MNEENKYDIQIEGIVEKKRYTAVEKARIVLASAEKADEVLDAFIGDLKDVIEPIVQKGQNSNNAMVVKRVNVIATKLDKILSK